VSSRTHVVTGAASGIGRATGDLLRARGHRVIGVDRVDAEICVDLATPEGRAELVDAVNHLTGGAIDAVVVAAGTAQQGATDISVNYFGAVATLVGLRPLLAGGDSPRAALVASYAVVGPVSKEVVDACLSGDEAGALAVEADDPLGFVTYASSKRALARWMRRQAVSPDWAGAAIALNAVAPGIVRTPMTAGLLADPRLSEALQEAIPMPLGGIAEPRDVAELLAFLTSDACRATTGQTIFVDGGSDCITRGDDVFGG
jgi:NAD(P)-dependent dehydrogenase (short-subunit alcohol dehydrogenase family)